MVLKYFFQVFMGLYFVDKSILTKLKVWTREYLAAHQIAYKFLRKIPTKIQTFMQLDKNTMNNNNHSSVDIHNMNEFPPLT